MDLNGSPSEKNNIDYMDYRLHSSKNLAEITELAQDRKCWRELTSQMEKAIKVSQTKNWHANKSVSQKRFSSFRKRKSREGGHCKENKFYRFWFKLLNYNQT